MRTALALCFALLAGSGMAQDMTADEREAFRAEVRAYLLENPEVIMEAVAILQQREEAAAAQADLDLVAAYADELFNDPTSFVGGNPDGDITIVEFLDYRCGYCKRAHPEVAELLTSDGNIRWIIKEFPILGDQSVFASRFALAVKMTAGDETYEIVHDTLMTMRGDINDESLTRLAQELGLDISELQTVMASDEVTTIIDNNRALAQAMQINGTPTFVFETELLRGYVPLDQMRGIVAALRG